MQRTGAVPLAWALLPALCGVGCTGLRHPKKWQRQCVRGVQALVANPTMVLDMDAAGLPASLLIDDGIKP